MFFVRCSQNQAEGIPVVTDCEHKNRVLQKRKYLELNTVSVVLSSSSVYDINLCVEHFCAVN